MHAPSFLPLSRTTRNAKRDLGDISGRLWNQRWNILLKCRCGSASCIRPSGAVLCPISPYSLIFSIEPKFILIIAVAHVRRKPEYWHGRAERHG